MIEHRPDRSIRLGRFYPDLGYVDEPPEWKEIARLALRKNVTQ